MKVIINGAGGEHDDDVESSFILGYESTGGMWSGTIAKRVETLELSLIYAEANDYDCVVRSVTDMSSLIQTASAYYPTVQTFMPAGSNEHIEVYSGSLVNIVIAGCGVTSNLTAYNTEFYSTDPLSQNNLSSYSNGYIAGQIAYIKDTLNCSWWEARYRARVTSSTGGTYSDENGYGKIQIANAIAYTGEIITDPYNTLGDIGTINAELTNDYTGTVSITIDAVTNALEYEIYKDGVLIATIDELTYEDTITRKFKGTNRYYYQYKAKRNSDATDLSNKDFINYYKYSAIAVLD